jgi:nucleoporin p58/p45
MFGGSQLSTGGGLVGQSAGTTAAGGSGLFGGSQQQQQQQQGALNITPLTRPSDLPESIQKELEALDDYINQQGRIGEELKAGHDVQEELIDSIPRDVELVTRQLRTALEALKYDHRILSDLKKKSELVVQDAEACLDLLAHMRNPVSLAQSTYGGSSVSKFGRKGDTLYPYFNAKIDEFGDRLRSMASMMTEIERGVEGVEQEISEPSHNANDIVAALREEYALFMTLGSRVAELHHAVDRLEIKPS